VGIEVCGSVSPGFEAVRDAFEANFAHHGEVGAACAVYRNGQPVVDVWGGVADARSGRPWERDTVALVFSTTKGVTATCVHLLAERGELDVDAPVAHYWPEFAAEGKGQIPVRWILSHRAGVAAIDAELTLEEVLAWDPVVAAVAAQKPNWEPGSAHGYHVRSFGWALGEIVRRISGRSLGRFLADEIAGPLGLDFWIGLPEAIEPRCAALLPPRLDPEPGEREDTILDKVMAAHPLMRQALTGPSGRFAYDEMWNRRDLHAAEMPSSNGIGDARSLARLYAALVGEVDGRRLLRPETLAAATAVQSQGPDRVILAPTAFGLGYSLPPMLGPAAGRRSFGHMGSGGSLAFADPEAGIGFAYVMNQMHFDLTGDARSEALVRAVYGCL
jgi:CubicO group peptidase (beta-lactamase class C family)